MFGIRKKKGIRARLLHLIGLRGKKGRLFGLFERKASREDCFLCQSILGLGIVIFAMTIMFIVLTH